MVEYAGPFLLSDKGSTRATAYCFSNKSLTIDGRTHVVWLDAVSIVCGKTYDHETGEWSETFTIGEGQDNHATPCIAADSRGHVHIAYGPHARGWNDGRFKYAVSKHPNRIDEWDMPRTEVADFGYRATYACMVMTPEDLPGIVYRGGDYPLSTLFQRMRACGGWSAAKNIFVQEIAPQYTHYGSICACGVDGVIYVAAHFYNLGATLEQPQGTGSSDRSYGVAILKTAGMGATWTALDGRPVNPPCLFEKGIAVPPYGADVRVVGLAVDSAGRPWVVTMSAGIDDAGVYVSSWDAEWRTQDLSSALPDGRVAVGGSMTVDKQDRVHLALTAVNLEAYRASGAGKTWGHPSCEVFHVVLSPSSGQTECTQVSEPDETTANWLANISRGEIFAPVEKPVILYTHGGPGVGCSPPTETEAYCVIVK